MLKSLNSDEYHIFNDIILPDKSGGTTQIDHIVFSRYGIFVIETKNLNMNGDIYGDLYSAQWCQSFHSKKYQIKNPFQQNFKHIKYLSETTCLPIECFENIVIILGANDIKIRDHHPKNLVKNYHELIDCIKSFTEIRLNDSILSNAEQLLQKNFLENTRVNHQKHVEHVKKIVTDKSKNPVICPQCGSEMILREAKNGSFAGNKFWGCSRYPECKCKINTYSKDNFNGNNTPETLPPTPTGAIQCPECGSKMIIREAKNGSFAGNKFWGCSRYPECKCKINISKEQP